MMPTKNRCSPSYLLEHEEYRVLLDCGHTTLARLLDRDIDIRSIDAVFLTHFHTDHSSDLLPVIHARWIDERSRNIDFKNITLLGPQGLQENIRKLCDVFMPGAEDVYPLTYLEGLTTTQIGPFAVQPFPVFHVPNMESMGYRIDCNGSSLAYAGDAGPEQSEKFFDAIHAVDVLLVEAGTTKPVPIHCTSEQAFDMAKQVLAKRLVLTHIEEYRVEEVKEFALQYPEVVVAEDGLKLLIDN